MRKKNQESQAVETVAEQIENEAARRALEKARRGEKLTRAETASIRRLEDRHAEKTRWEIYTTIPKKDWRIMSGRAAQTLSDAAQRHGMPVAGAVISLPDVARWIHNFLAENTYVLRDADRVMAGDGVEQKRYRAAKAAQEEIKLSTMQGRYCDSEQLLAGLGIYFGSLRESFRILQKNFGPGACKDVQAAIGGAEKQCTDFLIAEMTKTGSLPPGVEPVKPKRKSRKATNKTTRRRKK